MTDERLSVVFEYGLEATLLEAGGLRLSAPHWDEEFQTARDLVAKYGLMPLCTRYQHPYGPQFHAFHTQSGLRVPAADFRNILFGGLSSPASRAFRQVWSWADAAAYHLGHMLDTYVESLALPAPPQTEHLGPGYVPADVPRTCPSYAWLSRLPFDRVYLFTGGDYSEGI